MRKLFALRWAVRGVDDDVDAARGRERGEILGDGDLAGLDGGVDPARRTRLDDVAASSAASIAACGRTSDMAPRRSPGISATCTTMSVPDRPAELRLPIP